MYPYCGNAVINNQPEETTTTTEMQERVRSCLSAAALTELESALQLSGLATRQRQCSHHVCDPVVTHSSPICRDVRGSVRILCESSLT